eukprot:TRINITY_DN369_c0_g1_i1.p1 TRINITY_DN369_c0_g1~~TRINITY_DN369_c0_g1_i1.p1  ORF type:complete len:1611 (-),score=299.81 TRINITY_DN369_c0_g1_i1:141-4973(-)
MSMSGQRGRLVAAAALYLASCLVPWASAGLVRIIDINPLKSPCTTHGLSVATGAGGDSLCVRSGFPMSSVSGNPVAAMAANGDVKGRRLYNRVVGRIEAYQKGSMDAFAAGTRDSSGVDSPNYVDGVSVTIGNPRAHLFTFAVAQSYDTNLGTAGLCACIPGIQTLVCGGSNPPGWLPYGLVTSPLTCDSGTIGGGDANWQPRRMVVTFDVQVASTTDVVEVRLMADQASGNEDVGIAILTIDIDEVEDNTPPVVTLIGPAIVGLLIGQGFVDPGSTCSDDVDGSLPTSSEGDVDTNIVGNYSIVHRCMDSHTNNATAIRVIIVQDAINPRVRIRDGPQRCIEEGMPYVELGALCVDNYDGISEAVVAGPPVNVFVPGNYYKTYTCSDSSGNVAHLTGDKVVVAHERPGDLLLLSVALQTFANGSYSAAGVPGPLSNVNPQTGLKLRWSGAFTFSTERCRFIEIRSEDGSLARRYEAVKLDDALIDGSLLTIPSELAFEGDGLQDARKYTLVVAEHFANASASGLGSLKQVFMFETGDYTGPAVAETSPREGTQAWPSVLPISILFAEDVTPGDGFVRLLRLGDDGAGYITTDAEVLIPCNGTISSDAEALHVQMRGTAELVVNGLGSWSSWRSCAEYSLEVGSDCVRDLSENANAFAKNTTGHWLRFVTSCLAASSPTNGSVSVRPGEPIVLTFAEPVQGGGGDTLLAADYETTLPLNAARDFPKVFIDGSTLTLDLACRRKACKIYTAAGITGAATSNSSSPAASSFCGGGLLRRCRGQTLDVSVAEDALRLANRSWPNGSILAHLGSGLPAQLGGVFSAPSYHITLKPSDFSRPEVLLVDAAGTSETSIRVAVQLDEPGFVYCAAMGGDEGDVCSSLVLTADLSEALRCNSTSSTEDCTNCEHPRYKCVNKTSVQVTGGCSGDFVLEGYYVQCISGESDRTIMEGGNVSVVSAGQRHACAIRKVNGDESLRCWGKSDSIDAATGLPPTGPMSWVSVGYLHSCAVRLDSGEVVCFGQDFNGETSPPGGIFEQVACGYYLSCGLRPGGAVTCWGLNDEGQASPPSAAEFIALAAGYRHVCGLRRLDNMTDTTADNVECWGFDNKGQASPPSGSFLSLGQGGAILAAGTLAAGWYHTCGIQAISFTVQCWGLNDFGQSTPPSHSFLLLGAGSYHTCGIRRQVGGEAASVTGEAHCWGSNFYGQSAAPVTGARYSAIVGGDGFTCAIDRASSELSCWGRNDHGQATPPPGSFGLLDDYTTQVCSLTLTPGIDRITGAGLRDAEAAAATAAVDAAGRGHAEAILYLNGLSGSRTYDVYCYAKDNEEPVANVMGELGMNGTRQVVATLDRTPPTVRIVDGTVDGAASVTVTVELSEPGVAYCRAVRDGAPAPSEKDISLLGVAAPTDDSLRATVVLTGLAADEEFDVYCGARDLASQRFGAAGPSDNWTPYDAVLRSKFDVHTRVDLEPPRLLSTKPAHNAFIDCQPDGAALGCLATLVFTFNEDVFRGSGNVTLACLTNMALCREVVVPVDLPGFDGGSTQYRNSDFIVDFTTPLVDASSYKVSIDAGVVVDWRGNTFSLDVTCPASFNDAWRGHGNFDDLCADAFTFKTPS